MHERAVFNFGWHIQYCLAACSVLAVMTWICLVPNTGVAAVADFTGTYQGTFFGDDSGTWLVSIAANGKVTGSGVSAEDGAFKIKGNIDSGGGFAAVAGRVSTGSRFQGQIASNGALSGAWRHRSGDSGSFSGIRLTTATTGGVFAGAYQGRFSGDDAGSWRIQIDSRGRIFGSGLFDEGGRFRIKGDVDALGNLAAVAGSNSTGSAYSGTIAENGRISGSWLNRRFGEAGSFAGDRVTTAMIVNIGSGLCLSGSGPDGALVLARCAASADQRFDLADDGTLRLYANLCLGKPPASSSLNSKTLIATVCDGSPEQAWMVQQITASHLTYGKKCGAVDKNGQAPGDPLVIKRCRGGSQGGQFALVPLGSQVVQCFGSAGADCARATDLPKVKTGRRSKSGTQKIPVSVGTIAHDNCCRQNPDGYHCHGPDTGEGQTRCLAEWWQAERDLKLGRFWKHTFRYSIERYGDDLTAVAGRPLLLPGQPGTGGGDSCDDPVAVANSSETAGTLAMAAPNGTKLDCTDEAFCASGHAQRPAGKDFIICAKTDSGSPRVAGGGARDDG